MEAILIINAAAGATIIIAVKLILNAATRRVEKRTDQKWQEWLKVPVKES